MTADAIAKGREPPSLEELRHVRGGRYPLWERLSRFVETRYQIAGEWSRLGPAEVGWGLRYRRRGKALVALYPQEGSLIAQVVLGRAQAERALDLKLGEGVHQGLRESPQLHDGHWLSIPVLDENDTEDVEILLLAKMRPPDSSA